MRHNLPQPAASFYFVLPYLCSRLIGVGLEPLGLEEFLEGNFFDGELFVDEKKESFRTLGFKRMSFLQLIPAVFF